MTSDRQLMAEAAQAAGIRPAAIVRWTDHFIDLNGIRFHYLDWGNPQLPHMVLLHGGSLTAHTWDLAALLLRDEYHIVALDQRGHGDTGWTPDADLDKDNWELVLDDTRLFLHALGYDRFVLVGMSMGGINSARYAARYPERLSAVCIVDVGPELMQEGLLEMELYHKETETLRSFEAFLERSKQFMPHRAVEHLRYSLTHSLKQTADGWTWKQDHRARHRRALLTEEERQAERDAWTARFWTDFRAVAVPTLLMRGDWSKILSQKHAEELAAAMPDARLVVIPRATHNVHSDNPADFAQELRAFLRGRAGS